MRPLHCSDFKREVIYIKDNDKKLENLGFKLNNNMWLIKLL
jgi:hypothetical protein